MMDQIPSLPSFMIKQCIVVNYDIRRDDFFLIIS